MTPFPARDSFMPSITRETHPDAWGNGAALLAASLGWPTGQVLDVRNIEHPEALRGLLDAALVRLGTTP